MTDTGPDFLDDMFDLPESAVPDIKYRLLHTALMTKLLEEAKNVPMNTAQRILIERIATNYIYIKVREASGFENLNPLAQDKQNVYLLSVLAQFQKMLAKATAQEDRENTLREVRDIITKVFKASESPAKQEVFQDLIREFKKVGI
jgi:DNA integrity scanning protein DisA with diadenylate cyclase activity